jgi:chemotaxis protein CheX
MATLDVVEELVLGTKDVFGTMLMMELEAEESSDQPDDIFANVSGMIGLGGDLRGMLSVHCPAEAAKEITGALIGMEIAELDDDVKDAIGEIANMIAGNIKISFERAGVAVELAIPSSIIGKSFRICGFSGATRCLVKFSMPASSFWVELLYVLNK